MQAAARALGGARILMVSRNTERVKILRGSVERTVAT